MVPGFKKSFSIIHDTIIQDKKFSLSKSGHDYNLNVYGDTIRVTDTLYKDKIVNVPGKVIDKTPQWIIWLGINWPYLIMISILVFWQRIKTQLKKKYSGLKFPGTGEIPGPWGL